jgi:hypothetical protein
MQAVPIFRIKWMPEPQLPGVSCILIRTAGDSSSLPRRQHDIIWTGSKFARRAQRSAGAPSHTGMGFNEALATSLHDTTTFFQGVFDAQSVTIIVCCALALYNALLLLMLIFMTFRRVSTSLLVKIYGF